MSLVGWVLLTYMLKEPNYKQIRFTFYTDFQHFSPLSLLNYVLSLLPVRPLQRLQMATKNECQLLSLSPNTGFVETRAKVWSYLTASKHPSLNWLLSLNFIDACLSSGFNQFKYKHINHINHINNINHILKTLLNPMQLSVSYHVRSFRPCNVNRESAVIQHLAAAYSKKS